MNSAYNDFDIILTRSALLDVPRSTRADWCTFGGVLPKTQVSSSDGELPASSTFTLLDGSGAMVATVVVHTSCSYPIHVGDIFGFLEITAMTMTSTSSDGTMTSIPPLRALARYNTVHSAGSRGLIVLLYVSC